MAHCDLRSAGGALWKGSRYTWDSAWWEILSSPGPFAGRVMEALTHSDLLSGGGSSSSEQYTVQLSTALDVWLN